MIRASAKTPNGPLMVVGLSEGNVERLKADRPISADFRSFGIDMPGNVLLFYGRTEGEMEARLRDGGLITDETHCVADPAVDRHEAARREHERILIATVGLPRSGKTTWARTQAYPIVNPDSIRLAIHGQRFHAPAEPLVWATAKIMARSLFMAGHRTVILDATNVERKRRVEWRSKEWGLFFKEIPTPREECLSRAVQGNDLDMVPVIERLAASYEPLGDDEMRW